MRLLFSFSSVEPVPIFLGDDMLLAPGF